MLNRRAEVRLYKGAFFGSFMNTLGLPGKRLERFGGCFTVVRYAFEAGWRLVWAAGFWRGAGPCVVL